MNNRRLRTLPDSWAGPILELVAITRGAATPPDVDPGPWARAEAGQHSVRTGFKAGRRCASAGQYAAHTLRIGAGRAARAGDRRTWVLELSKAGTAIDSWDWDERMRGALDLRAAYRDLPAVEQAEALPAQLVATWLRSDEGPRLVAATARLCEYVLEHPALDATDLARAWHATHGRRLARGSGT